MKQPSFCVLGGRGVATVVPKKISNIPKNLLVSDKTCDIFIPDVLKVFIVFERVFAPSLGSLVMSLLGFRREKEKRVL